MDTWLKASLFPDIPTVPTSEWKSGRGGEFGAGTDAAGGRVAFSLHVFRDAGRAIRGADGGRVRQREEGRELSRAAAGQHPGVPCKVKTSCHVSCYSWQVILNEERI